MQRFDFRRIGPHAIAERLRAVASAEKLEVEDEALALIAKSADGGMRDGLSLLDQVVSFGAGAVTAERVREVLGLISDDAYGELLRLVAERDARAVFPLVDRLSESGADLSEFVAGAGETLRAVLQVSLGGEPEGLTDAMAALVKKYGALLPAPDLLRLLTVLGAMEPQLRSSGQPRLVVEILLLRWAMMDRTVEIGEVIRALGTTGSGESGVVRGGSSGAAGAPPQLRDVVPAPIVPTPHSPLPRKHGPLTADRLRVPLALHHRASPGHAREPPRRLGGARRCGRHRHHRLARPRRGADAQARCDREAARAVGGRRGEGRGGRPHPPRPQRFTEATANAERLKVLRSKDPTLGQAVDALDLELME